MKRNKNLVPLSWEHHDGLVAAFRLKQGLKKNVEKEVLTEYLIFIWENNLLKHFDNEEQIFPNLMKSLDGGATELLERFESEHLMLRELVKRLMKNKKHTKEIVEQFSQLLERHIRFEERALFPFIEKRTPSEKMDELGGFFKERHQPACRYWPQAFWKSSFEAQP
jgi:hemerythrin-like domain-containing protein